MQALILAGGKGTRLRPLTVHTPKPIVPICNRSFLLYQIDTLRDAGITDITLSLSYQPDKIEQLLGDGSAHGVRIRYTVEPQPMGTAGAYKFAGELLREQGETFWQGEEWKVEVRGETGPILFALAFTAVVSPLIGAAPASTIQALPAL